MYIVNKLCRRVNRDVTMTTDQSSAAEGVADLSSLSDDAPKLDLAFKEGQTIKINITASVMSTYFCLIFELKTLIVQDLWSHGLTVVELEYTHWLNEALNSVNVINL